MIKTLTALLEFGLPTYDNLQICLELHKTQAIDVLVTFTLIRKCSWSVLNWSCLRMLTVRVAGRKVDTFSSCCITYPS